ncbi:hypothetical protein [Pseudomonas xionganensis]|uniref:Uncharacterized protein n=1 Tax=Pseudomonas xionganensis TaxID=2654845 RepID=A0A6I4KV16_9PSED|nr:hypothetical protein [Pseudomonas xionganensis]MVW74356.1 hypothetical protein [Pseudomonas xionganensis]
MLCHHLRPLEQELLAAGVRETYRGTPWSQNCREWVYFDVVLDTASLVARLQFEPCVEVSENLDAKSGTERGFYCRQCQDALMGLLQGARRYG